MRSTTRFGDNKTGVSADPQLASEMTQGMDRFPPTSMGDFRDIVAETTHYVDKDGGLGSVPRPTQTGADEAAWCLFVDKLGERLAFERTGVRLYDGLLAKLEAHDELPDGPERADLEHIRDQELEHFQTLQACMLEIGGDPTAMTPSADVVGVLAGGVGQIVADPRADLLASLEAILVAELADNDGWETLIELAHGVERDDIAERLEPFLEHEREHLRSVRGWIARAQGRASPAAPH